MKNIKILFSSLVIILFIASSISAQNGGAVDLNAAGFSPKGIKNYENYLDREIENGKIPGAVSLIYRNGHIAHSEAMGYNNMGTKEPMKKDKIFYIQSMTKPIISVAFMTLYEEGHFFLTDPVAKYLPEFADLKVMEIGSDENGEMTVDYVPLKRPIQIWHLLSHTAGFSHGLGENEYDQKLAKLLYGTFGQDEIIPAPHKSIKDRVNALVSYPLMGQPGEQWNYSASPDVLALLIEHFSGQTTEEFLQERIFDLLGMTDTGYNISDENMNRIAGLHQMQEDGSLAYVEPWGPVQGNTIYGGTHGLFSTAHDYMQFGLMLLNNGELNGKRIIGRKTLELMAEDHIDYLPYAPGNGFGLGFGVRTDVSDSKISGSEGILHWGGAFNTYFFVDQDEDLVAVLMTQSWPHTNLYASKLRQFVYSAIAD